MENSVTVDKGVCMSSGRCVLDEPDAFRFDAEQLAEPTPDVAGLTRDRIIAVMRACPSGAIRLGQDGPQGPAR